MQDLKKMFPHIAGYQKIKEECAQIIDVLSRSEEYIKRGAHIPRNWFFYGRSGVGKTRIVKDISEYLGFPMIEVSDSDAISKNISIEQDIVSGFDKAIELGNCIIFIDELDKIAGYDRWEMAINDNIKTAKVVLHELDRIKDYEKIVVVATANNPRLIGEYILRSGRFDRQIKFPTPSAKDRKEIIEYFLNGFPLEEEVDLEYLVRLTSGCSCADIETMVNEAKISCISKERELILLQDFITCVNKVKFKDVEKEAPTDDNQSKLIAIHEGGHALLSYLEMPETVNSVSIIEQGQAVGNMQNLGDDEIVKDQETILKQIKISIAGMLAVKIVNKNMTSGNGSDIEKALTYAKYMLKNGFYGFDYIADNEEGFRGPETEQDGKIINKAIEIIKECEIDVTQKINANLDKLNNLVKELVKNKQLGRRDIIKILE